MVEELREELRQGYDALAWGVIVRDARGDVVYANDAALRILGVARSDIVGFSEDGGAPLLDSGGLPLAERESPAARALATGLPVRGIVVGSRRGEGEIRWRLVHAVPLRDDAERIAQVVSSFLDITAQREAEQRLREQALRDALTDLPNRALFLDRLEHAIDLAKRDGAVLAVLLMDLDHFKEVNDTFGHQAGDELLRQAAARLALATRRSDSVARLGGDEFAFLLPGAAEEGARTVAQAVLGALQPPFTVEGQALELGASIGVALFPGHGEDAQSLLRRVDIAMYSAKRSGSGTAVYNFEDELDPAGPHRLALMAELRQALDQGQLPLLYQPVVDLASGHATRMEALVRWQHPTRGLVMPAEFIAPAERSGLVNPLFEHVLRTSLTECRTWHDAALNLRVAVNLSVRNLLDPLLPDTVARALDECGLTAASLALEITETMLMVDPERALRTLDRLRRAGVDLIIDDFGVGYSSFAYLQRLPVCAVKIDRSFIGDMIIEASSRSIVEGIVELAHRLGLRAVAEGVETPEVLELLREYGCDDAQGYLLGHPMSPDLIRPWITARIDERVVDIAALRRATGAAAAAQARTARRGAQSQRQA